MSDERDAVHEKVAEWIRSAPRGAACVADDVERFRNTTAQDRIDALREILATADRLVGAQVLPKDPQDDELWRRWMDPNRGRPR